MIQLAAFTLIFLIGSATDRATDRTIYIYCGIALAVIFAIIGAAL